MPVQESRTRSRAKRSTLIWEIPGNPAGALHAPCRAVVLSYPPQNVFMTNVSTVPGFEEDVAVVEDDAPTVPVVLLGVRRRRAPDIGGAAGGVADDVRSRAAGPLQACAHGLADRPESTRERRQDARDVGVVRVG